MPDGHFSRFTSCPTICIFQVPGWGWGAKRRMLCNMYPFYTSPDHICCSLLPSEAPLSVQFIFLETEGRRDCNSSPLPKSSRANIVYNSFLLVMAGICKIGTDHRNLWATTEVPENGEQQVEFSPLCHFALSLRDCQVF